MKTVTYSSHLHVTDIDLNNDDDCIELGHLVSEQCVVRIDAAVSEQRLFDIHALWGQAARALMHRYVGEKMLTGRHWRSLLANLGYISTAVDQIADRTGMSRVSFEKNAKGRPTGVFTNGELDWHSDQHGYHEHQRVVGLMSLWGTKNSQTSFLCTAPAYEALNAEDRSVVDELVSVYAWDGGTMAPNLIPSQKEIVHYNMVPVDGMECALVDRTASRRIGMRYPSHCFSHFRGMSRDESLKFRTHLWSKINQPEYVYTHDWQDGQIMFFDQNITLHARPTNIEDGDRRTLSRMISFMDKLYPGQGPVDFVMFDGERYDHAAFAALVDDHRRKAFQMKAIA